MKAQAAQLGNVDAPAISEASSDDKQSLLPRKRRFLTAPAISEASSDDKQSLLPRKRRLLTIQEVIDDIGFGITQIKSVIFGGCINFTEGAMLFAIVVLHAKSEHHGVSLGILFTLIILGQVIGFLCGGFLSDSVGRKDVLVISFMGTFVFGILCSRTYNLSDFQVIIFCTGFCMGFGRPAWYALAYETSPSRWRLSVIGLSVLWVWIGEVYSVFVFAVTAGGISFRDVDIHNIFKFASVPSAFMAIFSALCLHESPVCLAHNGDDSGAIHALESMRWENSLYRGESVAQLDVEFQQPKGEHFSNKYIYRLIEQLSVVLGRRYRAKTIMCTLSCFTQNLLHYGILYASPKLFWAPKEGPMGVLLWGSLAILPGVLLGVWVGMRCTRRMAMRIYLWGSAVALFIFYAGASDRHAFAAVLERIGFCSSRMFSMMGLVVIWQDALDIFPSEVHSTGAALCFSAGRAIASLAPVLFDAWGKPWYDNSVFLAVMFIFCAANAVLFEVVHSSVGALCSTLCCLSRLHDVDDAVRKESQYQKRLGSQSEGYGAATASEQ